MCGLAGGWGLDGGGCGVAGLVGGDDLLGLAGGGGLFFGGVDGLFVLGFTPGKEGESECYRCCGLEDRSGDHFVGLFLVYVLVTCDSFDPGTAFGWMRDCGGGVSGGMSPV